MTRPERIEQRAPQPAVICRRPQAAARMRLVTFAHAGGGPQTYTRWDSELAPELELWHAALPGRGRRRHEPFARDWDSLARDLAAAVARDVPAPFALFGHSLGALVAFEVARRLTCAGTPPAHLVVSGRDAPDGVCGLELPETDDELLRCVDRAYGGAPDQVRESRDVLDHFLPILRADLELARGYVLRPGVALSCPITALVGDADPTASPEGLVRWARQTGAGCECRVLPGGHFYLVGKERAALSTISRRLLA
jgi:medium-chain acyl-[acyl-carrier-protein] hydrolase